MAEAAQKAGYTDIFKKSLIGITEMERLMGKKKLMRFLVHWCTSLTARSHWCRIQIKEKQLKQQPQKRILRRTKTMTTANLTKVIVPCRLSYAHLWEPDSINGSEPKYSVSCIIDKNDKETIAKIKKAIEVAKDEGKGKWGGKIPANLKTPLRDGDIDRPEDEAYADSMFLNANSKQAPQIVDRQVQPILDQSEVYSGCYGRVSITFYAYNSNGNKGVAAGLGNVQKLRDGEPLGSRANARDEFEAVDAEDDFLA